MFNKQDTLLLHSTCADLINGGPLNQERIEDFVKSSILFTKYNWRQLRTRIMYERKKRTLSKKVFFNFFVFVLIYDNMKFYSSAYHIDILNSSR